MISKETFVQTMNELQALDEKMNMVDSAMKSLNRDFCSFYVTEPFDIIMGVLEEDLKDNGQWLNYFVWERNWLKDLQFGDITINDKPIKIKDWNDVYVFITEMC